MLPSRPARPSTLHACLALIGALVVVIHVFTRDDDQSPPRDDKVPPEKHAKQQRPIDVQVNQGNVVSFVKSGFFWGGGGGEGQDANPMSGLERKYVAGITLETAIAWGLVQPGEVGAPSVRVVLKEDADAERFGRAGDDVRARQGPLNEILFRDLERAVFGRNALVLPSVCALVQLELLRRVGDHLLDGDKLVPALQGESRLHLNVSGVIYVCCFSASLFLEPGTVESVAFAPHLLTSDELGKNTQYPSKRPSSEAGVAVLGAYCDLLLLDFLADNRDGKRLFGEHVLRVLSTRTGKFVSVDHSSTFMFQTDAPSDPSGRVLGELCGLEREALYALAALCLAPSVSPKHKCNARLSLLLSGLAQERLSKYASPTSPVVLSPQQLAAMDQRLAYIYHIIAMNC